MSRFSRLIAQSTLFTALACSGSRTAPPPIEPTKGEAPSEQQVDPRYRSLPTPQPAPTWSPPAASKTMTANAIASLNFSVILMAISLLWNRATTTAPVGF